MGSGMARGAHARGKRIAFGDGKTIQWHPYAHEIFRNNPNVAPPGSEDAQDIEWIAHYWGKRLYNRCTPTHWEWVGGHNNKPGEIFFSDEELKFASQFEPGFILIEPNVPKFKSVAVNKQWALDRYDSAARDLARGGHRIAQFRYGPPSGPGHTLSGVKRIEAPTFRHALAVLACAKLYIGPEGGLHHGAAAVGVPAVVIFGGFIAPATTGYDTHHNIFRGDGVACGSLKPCNHCKRALYSITVDEVVLAARGLL